MADEEAEDYVKVGPKHWVSKQEAFNARIDPLVFRAPKPRGVREPFFSSPLSLIGTVLALVGVVLYYRYR